MDVRARVVTWDAALRRGDWDEARAQLADYDALEEAEAAAPPV